MDFTSKAIRRDAIAKVIERFIPHADSLEWSASETDIRWDFNELAFHDQQESIDYVVLGKGRNAA
jgi:hypothetical protein